MLLTCEDPQAAPFNYFNYFTEVEDEFVRRRGKPLLISPLDWALVESWQNAGIPLHIVLRSINETFDAYDKRVHKRQKINSIFYCQQAVESNFAEYRLSQVGGGKAPDSSLTPSEGGGAGPFSKSELLDFLGRCNRELLGAAEEAHRQSRLELEDALTRSRARLDEIAREIEGSVSVDTEALERDLDSLDRMIVENVRMGMSEEAINDLRKEAKSQLRSYKKKMDKEIYEQTVENFVARRFREISHVPRLSLFYM